MRPYFDEGGVTLYCADALDVMREMAPASVDTMLTDPPYCSGGYLEAQKNTDAQGLRGATVRAEGFQWFASDNMSTAGLVWLLRSVMIEARRLLRPNRSCFLFTDWRMVAHLVPALESCGMRYRNLIVWDKGNAGLGVGFKPAHELILEFSNGSTEYRGLTGQNVIRTARVPASAKEHAAQKPVAVLSAILSVATPAGGIVLDPFMGSGSVAVAAKRDGYAFVGAERERHYCEIAARRLSQGVLPLFGAAS